MQNQPLFTSSSGLNQDEFDLGEVFAEYFSNEFDNDPLNAYTNSMANYSFASPSALPPAAAVHAAALQAVAGGMSVDNKNNGVYSSPGAVKSNGDSNFFLPTGGIKTAFHIGSTTASTRPPDVVAPPQKRAKSEDYVAAQSGMMGAQSVDGTVAALALAHQQAASAAIQQQAQFAASLQSMGMQQIQQESQQTNNLLSGTTTVLSDDASRGVALPVGVGIRLGGMGGIAPATAQASARPPVVQAQYAAGIWGGLGGGFGVHPGVGSQAAAVERRLRNREHAKRSRVRKKFMLESMQEQVKALQLENQNLRLLIQEHIPEHAQQIIAENCSTSPLFTETEADEDGSTKLGRSDFSLIESLTAGQRCFVLSDPKLPDNPIVFASGGFYEMTGYTAKEVLGRNCRFLQGPGTDPRAVDVIRKAIVTGADATVCLLNYKADGTPFWNQFFLAALRDSDNCIVNYVGVQCEVAPEQGDSAVEEKVNEVLPLAAKGGTGSEDDDDE